MKILYEISVPGANGIHRLFTFLILDLFWQLFYNKDINIQQEEGGIIMAVLDGCESAFKTPIPEEHICPQCGKEIEVFTVKGRVVEDTACECGYVIKADEPDSPMTKKKEQ